MFMLCFAIIIIIIIIIFVFQLHVQCIRKYGSTFYIGIAMVVLPYFGPEFSLSVSTQFDFYQHQGGTHVES